MRLKLTFQTKQITEQQLIELQKDFDTQNEVYHNEKTSKKRKLIDYQEDDQIVINHQEMLENENDELNLIDESEEQSDDDQTD